MINKKQNTFPINGILLVNKPQGLSSNAVLQTVKRLFMARKAGHTGSLDPLATGMLPICFGEATKFSQFLLQADKTYKASGLLGIQTDTADATGKVIQSLPVDISEFGLKKVISEFVGKTEQIPPMFSAVKVKGQPLYHLARKGITVSRQARSILIRAIELTYFDGLNFSITVQCSKGTYIRSLIEDIGKKLGISAHVTALHRVNVQEFENEPMYTLDELRRVVPQRITLPQSTMPAFSFSPYLLPVERAVDYLPCMIVGADDLLKLYQGKFLDLAGLTEIEGLVRLKDEDKNFVGLGELSNDKRLKVKRLLAAVPSPISI